jgi:hypothetical protein
LNDNASTQAPGLLDELRDTAKPISIDAAGIRLRLKATGTQLRLSEFPLLKVLLEEDSMF